MPPNETKTESTILLELDQTDTTEEIQKQNDSNDVKENNNVITGQPEAREKEQTEDNGSEELKRSDEVQDCALFFILCCDAVTQCWISCFACVTACCGGDCCVECMNGTCEGFVECLQGCGECCVHCAN